ncbi:MAG: SprT-like domain-containing protein [Thermoanaerobaculia bacterium]
MRSSAQPIPRDSQRTAPGRGRSGRPEAVPAAGRPVQLELFVGRPVQLPAPADPAAPADPNALLRRLNRLTGGRLRSLELTDNRKTILSVRAGRIGNRAPFELRIHHSFTQAPEEVLQAVARFVESRRGSDQAREALVLIREHFSAHRAKARTRKIALQPEGVALDLREVLADLNERYFESRLDVRITWGKASTNAASCRRRRSASLQLGSYSYEDRLIRLHRVLDHPDVPRYVVEAVVYHELLHADMPPEIHNGKRQYHTPEFRKRERQYRNLTRAERWIGENMPELLKARAAMGRGKKR